MMQLNGKFGRLVGASRVLVDKYEKLVEKIIEWKEKKLKIEEMTELCDNQKKSLVALYRVLQVAGDENIKKKLPLINSLYDKIKKKANDSHALRENSGFFEHNKKNEVVLGILNPRK
jgi:hypothetical protein